jgi:hypothetical protein
LIPTALPSFRQAGKREALEEAPAKSALAALLIGLMTWVVFGSFIIVDHGPHGNWDAWANWNSKARVFSREGKAWLDHMKDTSHSDYPLLLPGATARLWRYVGHDFPAAEGSSLC